MNQDLNQILIQANNLREQKQFAESDQLCQSVFNSPDANLHLKTHALLIQSITSRLQNNFSQAKQLVSQALALPPPIDDQHLVYFEQGTIAESEKDFSSASKFYQLAADSLLSTSPLGLINRYQEHAAWAAIKSGNQSAFVKLNTSILNLEKILSQPEIASDSSDFGQKYTLQVWLSRAYMHLFELGDTSVVEKLNSLLSSNPKLSIRKEQWEKMQQKKKTL